MNRSTLIASTLSVLLLGLQARAGIDAGKTITTSDTLSGTASHVVLGRLEAFHAIASEETKGPPGMSRYVAEITVAKVEKGRGVEPEGRVFVRFWSPWTKDELDHQRGLIPSCGDRKIAPIPGEWLRIYFSMNENYEYVADHPDCFFRLEHQKQLEASRLKESGSWATSARLGAATVLGFAVGFVTRGRNRAGTKSGYI